MTIVLYVSEWGSFVMKSRDMDMKGRVYDLEGMGNKGGFSFVGLFFQDW